MYFPSSSHGCLQLRRVCLKSILIILTSLFGQFVLAQCPAGGITNPGSVSGGNTYRITVNHTVSICFGSCVKTNMTFNVCNGKKLTWSGSGSISMAGTQVCLYDDATFSNTFFGAVAGFGGAHTVLPIILGDYSAQQTEDGVALNWETLKEVNNDYFIVQRSRDALNWSDVAQIPGAGNSNHPINYSYTDESFGQVAFYYRIKQVDFDGQSETFDILTVDSRRVVGQELELFPNPASSLLFINESSLNTSSEFEIISESGVKQEVSYERTLEFSQVDISLLETGQYIFQATNNQGVIVKRFVKQ